MLSEWDLEFLVINGASSFMGQGIKLYEKSPFVSVETCNGLDGFGE